MLASFWVGVARLSLKEAELYKTNVQKDVKSRAIWKVAPGFYAKSIENQVFMPSTPS